MKYLFYTNTGKASDLQLPHGISIRKRMPRMFVDGMTEMDKIYLYGAGGHGKVIKEIIEACGGKVEAFVDDNLSRGEWAGLPVVHSVEGIEEMIVSIGNNKVRKMIAGKLDCRFGVAIHPSAIVSPSATIGEGTVVMPGAIVNADAVIGRHCIVNTGASVGHDCHLEDFCHVAPHATLCGTVHLGEGVWIGAGAVVNPNIEIGEWTVVGSASAVIGNVEPNVTVVGVPARKI